MKELSELSVRVEGLSTKFEIQPLEIFQNVIFDISSDCYPLPFASKEEVHAFLSGSEHWTLLSDGEPLFSRDFVQCAAALVRNRQTGKITLIHESVWSGSATVALGIQRIEDIDVITIAGPFGTMAIDTIKYYHEKVPRQTMEWIESTNTEASRRYGDRYPGNENQAHIFQDYSALLGISDADLENRMKLLTENPQVGETRYCGSIRIPVERNKANRWYLLFRPEENVIWIYESGTKTLYKYPGFDILAR